MKRVIDCRGCGAPMFFARTGTGSKIPLDVEPSSDGEYALEGDDTNPLAYKLPNDTAATYTGEKYVSHFKTCPKASSFGKNRRPTALCIIALALLARCAPEPIEHAQLEPEFWRQVERHHRWKHENERDRQSLALSTLRLEAATRRLESATRDLRAAASPTHVESDCWALPGGGYGCFP